VWVVWNIKGNLKEENGWYSFPFVLLEQGDRNKRLWGESGKYSAVGFMCVK